MSTKKNSIFKSLIGVVDTLDGLEPQNGALVVFNGQLYIGNGQEFVVVGGGGSTTQGHNLAGIWFVRWLPGGEIFSITQVSNNKPEITWTISGVGDVTGLLNDNGYSGQEIYPVLQTVSGAASDANCGPNGVGEAFVTSSGSQDGYLFLYVADPMANPS